MSSLRELYLARLREFTRQKARIFWVYGFPMVLAIGLGLAFKSPAAPSILVDLVRPASGSGAGPVGTLLAAKDALKTTYAGPNWSIVDRNVQGGGDSYLRSGPIVTTVSGVSAPPLGIGSLGIRTAGASDKTAFGNQVDFVGDLFSAVTAVQYSVFATGEDFSGGATNLPSVSFELSFPAGQADPGFHTLFYHPSISATDVNKWTALDAVADTTAHWGLSGAAGTTCDQNGALCTFAQVQTYLAANDPGAQILTVQITKGSGQPPFSGAVDALRLNNDIFDFEPFGVSITHP